MIKSRSANSIIGRRAVSAIGLFLLVLLLWQMGLFIAPASAASRTPSAMADQDTVMTDGTVWTSITHGNTTYIGGGFGLVGQYTGYSVAYNAASGTPEKPYPIVDNTVRAAVSDGSGGWFIGGDFTVVGRTTRNHIAHINVDGSLDTSWNPNADQAVYSLALSPDRNYLYVGGDFANIGGAARSRIAKLSASGAETQLPHGTRAPTARYMH